MRKEGRAGPRDIIAFLTGGSLGVQMRVTISGFAQYLEVFKLVFWHPCDKHFTSEKQ